MRTFKAQTLKLFTDKLNMLLYLCPLENRFGVHSLGLAWIVLVSFDPTDVFTPPKAPLPQALKRRTQSDITTVRL